MSRPFMPAFLALSFPVLVLLPGAIGPAARAATPAEETIFQSGELRIYRTVNRDGTPVVVLTNVDAEGRYFPGRPAEASVPAAPARRSYEPVPAAPAEKPERPIAGPVKVVVNTGDGASAVDPDSVEVSTEAGGGTTVIVNVHPQAPAPRETVVIPAIYQPVAYGGLVGPVKYPDHQYFLGYAPGTSSPSYFGGLGLNAGNRFGLKTGRACDRGYDCMFGPTGDRP